jgi:putative methionine-R-sulfoxide reductase with GAF domain
MWSFQQPGPALFDAKWWGEYLVSNPQLVLGPQLDVASYQACTASVK